MKDGGRSTKRPRVWISTKLGWSDPVDQQTMLVILGMFRHSDFWGETKFDLSGNSIWSIEAMGLHHIKKVE